MKTECFCQSTSDLLEQNSYRKMNRIEMRASYTIVATLQHQLSDGRQRMRIMFWWFFSFRSYFIMGFILSLVFFSLVLSFICFSSNCSLLMMERRSISEACITYLCRYFFTAYIQMPAHQCIKALNITRNVMNHTDFVSHSSGNNTLPWSEVGAFFQLLNFVSFYFFFFRLPSMYLFPKLWPETWKSFFSSWPWLPCRIVLIILFFASFHFSFWNCFCSICSEEME